MAAATPPASRGATVTPAEAGGRGAAAWAGQTGADGALPSAAGTDAGNVSRPLVWLRWVAVLVSAAAVVTVNYGLAIELPMRALTIVIGAYAACALWSLALHVGQIRRGSRLDPPALLALLLIDIAALSALLYFTGGWTNPVVSVYLVPVAVGAAVLPARHAIAVALACAVAYSVLTIWYVPLPSVHGRFGGDFNVHVAGMWINFLVASLLVAVFVAVLARRAREMDQALMRARERQLRDEHIVALGTLAAGAAHELSTPLTTLTMLVDELSDAPHDDPEHATRLAQARRQLALMRDRLRLLRADTAQLRGEWATRMTAADFLHRTVDRWRASRPEVIVAVDWSGADRAVALVVDETVSQALASILNNAADASRDAGTNRIAVAPEIEGERLVITVVDWGAGLEDAERRGLGRRRVSDKAGGHGIGLVLSHASLERCGGSVRYERNAHGGGSVSLVLPLADERAAGGAV